MNLRTTRKFRSRDQSYFRARLNRLLNLQSPKPAFIPATAAAVVALIRKADNEVLQIQ
jgi:5,10-methylene-tetrahydrofolate dehydrogenase/methenyl tetrahydrofolate cyclohydrolase